MGKRQTVEVISDPAKIAAVLSAVEYAGIPQVPGEGGGSLVDIGHCAYRLPPRVPGALPTSIERVRRRAHRRVGVSPRVQLMLRDAEGVLVAHPLRDVSMGGLSFFSHAAQRAARPGDRIRGHLRWRSGADIPMDLTVCHVCRVGTGPSIVVGCSLQHRPLAYAEAVDALLHPRTHRGRVDQEELWDLYDASGYFNLSDKETPEFASLRGPYVRAESSLRDLPHLGAMFTVEGLDGLEVAITQLCMWDRSWLIHQLARSPRPRLFAHAGHQPLVDVYTHAYEHVLEQGGDWLVTYVQQVARWSKAAHHDVCEPWIDAGLASITPFAALEVSSRFQPAASVSLEVRPARPSEYEALERRLREMRPAPYIEGTGLSADALASGAARSAWDGSGLLREQHVLVASSAGRPLAFAVLDATPHGLHLFRLTQACRIYGFRPLDWPTVAELVRIAGEWFQQRGISTFVYLAEEVEAPRQVTGIRNLGDAWTTVVSSELTHEYIEHIVHLAAPVHPLYRDVDAALRIA